MATLSCLICVMMIESVGAASEEPPAPRPNLLFAMADQLRWDAAVPTPNLDRVAAEGARVRFSWSSTPTCTPARAALLTGRRPWGHGMLGYGQVAEHYPLVFPRVLRDAGYTTVSLGKDHFGWNATSDTGIAHGYQRTELYDGLGRWAADAPNHWSGEYDDYDRWFANKTGGKDPQATLDGLDGDGWNGWHGRAYVYDEQLHPTAWLGARAVAFLESHANASAAAPFLLKVSFHRRARRRVRAAATCGLARSRCSARATHPPLTACHAPAAHRVREPAVGSALAVRPTAAAPRRGARGESAPNGALQGWHADTGDCRARRRGRVRVLVDALSWERQRGRPAGLRAQQRRRVVRRRRGSVTWMLVRRRRGSDGRSGECAVDLGGCHLHQRATVPQKSGGDPLSAPRRACPPTPRCCAFARKVRRDAAQRECARSAGLPRLSRVR